MASLDEDEGPRRLTSGAARGGSVLWCGDGSVRLAAVAYRRRLESVELVERWRGVADDDGDECEYGSSGEAAPTRGAGELTRDELGYDNWLDERGRDEGGGYVRSKSASAGEDDRGKAANVWLRSRECAAAPNPFSPLALGCTLPADPSRCIGAAE